jgi:phosphomannomutase
MEERYLDGIRSLAVHPKVGDRTFRIVYTPLHGCGNTLVRAALADAGFTNVWSVPEQAEPDGAFPTVAFPNPEEKGAMDLAFALAKKLGARLVLANDPDVDRLSVGIPEPNEGGGFRQLTGNEVGVLLGHYLLTEKPTKGRRAVLASIVSSPLLGRIAAALGVHYEETLTGFKWLATRSLELEREGYDVVLAYEEALGYSVGTLVRDKDGISAAALAAEVAAVLADRGRTMDDELDAIARQYGVYVSTQHNSTRKGPDGPAAIREMMTRLRTLPPAAIAGDAVAAVTDYSIGGGGHLPKSDVLSFALASGSRIVARPSGTEPKAKFYFDVREEVRAGEAGGGSVKAARARALAHMEELKAAFLALLS